MNNALTRFAQNKSGRDFVVGDIHGQYDQLMFALEQVGFTDYDRLFCVGDLVNKGQKSMECLSLTREDWFHSALGNHDYRVMIDIQNHLLGKSKHLETLWLKGMTVAELEFVFGLISDMPLLIEFESRAGKIGIAHADIPFIKNDKLVKNDGKIPNDKRPNWQKITKHIADGVVDSGVFHSVISDGVNAITLRRNESTSLPSVKGIDRVYLGHVTVGRPLVSGNRVWINTLDRSGLTLIEIKS